MKLLKVLIAVAITACISLLLSSNVQAVDHPWDDNKNDTTTVGMTPQVQDGSTNESPVVITRITEWARLFFLEIKGFILGEVKHEQGNKPPSGTKSTKGNYPRELKK